MATVLKTAPYTQQILLSILTTCRQQGKDSFDQIMELFNIADSDRAGAYPQQFVIPIFKSLMNHPTVIRFAGRCFSSEDVALMCLAARDYASPGYHRDRAHRLRVAGLETAQWSIEKP